MDWSPIIVAAIGAVSGVLATIGGLLASLGKSRESRRAQAAEEQVQTAQQHAREKAAEAERLLGERLRIDARWEQLVNELEEDNTRLRARLDRRDGTP